MAQIELNNLSLLLKEIGIDVVDRFKKSMDRPTTHRNGQKYNAVASGRTKDSAKSRVDISGSAKLIFDVDDRYLAIRDGQEPGKFANWSSLRTWMVDRRINTSDNKENRRNLALINRSIKQYGIRPRPFLDLVTLGKTINSALNSELSDLALDLETYRVEIVKAIVKDIVIYFKSIANGN
jgi:hypothetical protein